MFVALSKFTVANDMDAAVKQAFRERPHEVDSTPGFIKLDVISPEVDPKEIWLITYWENRNSFESWHNSHSYRDSHAGIPKGLKLVPKSASVCYFEHIAS
jgi:heme oxygenase (mycobilin-producing)